MPSGSQFRGARHRREGLRHRDRVVVKVLVLSVVADIALVVLVFFVVFLFACIRGTVLLLLT